MNHLFRGREGDQFDQCLNLLPPENGAQGRLECSMLSWGVGERNRARHGAGRIASMLLSWGGAQYHFIISEESEAMDLRMSSLKGPLCLGY